MYYLIEITTKADKTEKGVYGYEDLNDAIANFHTKLGGAMKNDIYLAEMLMVIDERGAVQISDFYARSVEE